MKHPILLSMLSLALSAAVPAMAQTAAPAGSTGQCKDGSYTSASFKMGACRGHKGVQAWYGGNAAAAKPASAKGIGSAGMKNATATAPVPATPAPVPAAVPTRPAPVATPTPAPVARAPRAMPAPGPVAAGGGNGQVWVNMKTKVYHCQGDRWYGTSKDGQYMSESAAVAAGARASRNKSCSGT